MANNQGPDANIVDRLRKGDVAALEQLYLAHHAGLCEFAFSYVRDQEISRDIVSDLFVRLWESRANLLIKTTLRGYLYSTVRNRALNYIRDTQRHNHAHDMLAGGGEVPGMGDPSPDVDSVPPETIWAAVEKLPERSRQILTLRWQLQMTVPEIAEALGVTEMTIHVAHSRALKSLRELLPKILD